MRLIGFHVISIGTRFNPRTRTGCDCSLLCAFPRKRRFNPRTRTGCDRLSLYFSTHVPSFQPTHPHGVRPPFTHIILRLAVFQPTHPHGVRRRTTVYAWRQDDVSTHAPARGATIAQPASNYVAFVSTHAPARGATIRPSFRGTIQNVSTHAPARGATLCLIQGYHARRGFNPRTRTGCDVRTTLLLLLCLAFQPTHPHGVRRTSYIRLQAFNVFQPTHPHGVRLRL